MTGLALTVATVLSGGIKSATAGGKNDSLAVVYARYDSLYRAIDKRQADAVYPFTGDSLPEVRAQAWRALASTPVDDMAGMMQRVHEDGSPEAWFALSMHKLREWQLRQLESYWLREPDQRSGIALVLGRQGNKQSLQFLFAHLDSVKSKAGEYAHALAIGRLMLRHKASISQQLQLIRAAFEADQPAVTRAYLYGAYRSKKTVLDSGVKQTLFKLWQFYGTGNDPYVDQYLSHILGYDEPKAVWELFRNRRIDSLNVQVGVELTDLLARDHLDEQATVMALGLLGNPNPVVRLQTLDAIRQTEGYKDTLYTVIDDSLLKKESTPDQVWVSALQTMVREKPEAFDIHFGRLDSLSGNVYLKPAIFRIYAQVYGTDDYLDYLQKQVQGRNPLTVSFVLAELNRYVKTLEPDQLTPPRVGKIRSMFRTSLNLNDRGVAYNLALLAENKRLIQADDYPMLAEGLKGFTLPEDIEVYQSFARLFKDRFAGQAQSLIDSLAALGYAPLNRSLADMGWQVPETGSDSEIHEFRKVDWKRLAEMGPHPVWTLVTTRDTIRIRLNPLVAPATVSAVDSLTRAGAYDGIPIHRVVPNFVIQGGDIERGDGFGGPDFVIPTEASELEFERGAVGIASAGTDTEGSQFFVMHQWAPHLNGRYTRFGKVVEGMDAVDRIMVGDKVLKAFVGEEEK